MRPLLFLVIIAMAIQFAGCGGGPSSDLSTAPEIDPGIRQTDLSSIEGTWDYNLYAFSVMEFDDGMQIAQDELVYAFTITSNTVYDPYYQSNLSWSFENGELFLSYEEIIVVDEYFGFTDINVDTEVKYTISLNADKTQMEIYGTAVTKATFTSPDAAPGEIKSTTSYTGIAIRQM